MWKIFQKENEQTTDENSRCSFCSKRQADVKKIIAGPEVNICDECILLCNELLGIKEDEIEEPLAPLMPPFVPTGLSCSLCRFPVEEGGFKIIHDRGPLCLACLEAIREYF